MKNTRHSLCLFINVFVFVWFEKGRLKSTKLATYLRTIWLVWTLLVFAEFALCRSLISDCEPCLYTRKHWSFDVRTQTWVLHCYFKGKVHTKWQFCLYILNTCCYVMSSKLCPVSLLFKWHLCPTYDIYGLNLWCFFVGMHSILAY